MGFLKKERIILYACHRWIFLQNYSGLVSYFLLDYPFIYHVVQRELLYFTHRLLPDLLCLSRVRLGVHF